MALHTAYGLGFAFLMRLAAVFNALMQATHCIPECTLLLYASFLIGRMARDSPPVVATFISLLPL